jgi:hypothetical protein
MKGYMNTIAVLPPSFQGRSMKKGKQEVAYVRLNFRWGSLLKCTHFINREKLLILRYVTTLFQMLRLCNLNWKNVIKCK